MRIHYKTKTVPGGHLHDTVQCKILDLWDIPGSLSFLHGSLWFLAVFQTEMLLKTIQFLKNKNQTTSGHSLSDCQQPMTIKNHTCTWKYLYLSTGDLLSFRKNLDWKLLEEITIKWIMLLFYGFLILLFIVHFKVLFCANFLC